MRPGFESPWGRHFLRFCRTRYGISLDDVVPKRFDQFILFLISVRSKLIRKASE